MKCVYCAEEIQDVAIVCRFCGATKNDEQWVRNSNVPAAAPLAHGHTTIRIAAAFYLLAAFFEIVNVFSPVPLLGSMRGGLVALFYHVIYVVLFGAVGFSLWKAWAWGPKSVLVLTVFYSLDKLLYLFDAKARSAEIGPLLEMTGGLVDESMIFPMVNAASITALACWWGFAAYIYWRREYFQAQ